MLTIENFDIGALWSSVWPFILAIFLFGVIIAIHEFGHFSFAKLFDVQINEFSLGMGPKIIKKKKGETTYALRLLPIGGFVSMEGEDEERAKILAHLIISLRGRDLLLLRQAQYLI